MTIYVVYPGGTSALILADQLHICGHAFDRALDRKSTRLNSSHLVISYAVFCLKKKSLFQHTDLYAARQRLICSPRDHLGRRCNRLPPPVHHALKLLVPCPAAHLDVLLLSDRAA